MHRVADRSEIVTVEKELVEDRLGQNRVVASIRASMLQMPAQDPPVAFGKAQNGPAESCSMKGFLALAQQAAQYD